MPINVNTENLTLAEKARLVSELTEEIVEAGKKQSGSISGLMNVFGDQFIEKAELLKGWFSDIN